MENEEYVSYGELLKRERDIEYWHLLDQWTLHDMKSSKSSEV